MKVRFGIAFLLLMGLGGLLAACGPAAPPASPPPVKDGKPAGAAPGAWDELLAAARREGTLNIYATAVQAGIVPLRESFGAKYGINLEFVQGRPPEVTAKIDAERRAGLYLADIGHLGETTQTMDIKPKGILQPIAPLIVQPDITDPKNWLGGRVPYLDKDTHGVMFAQMAIPHAVVSTELVKPGELSSFTDILDPKWKGKIIFSDPTISGTSPNLLAALHKVLGEQKAIDVFKKLAAHDVQITRDQRLLLESVARGKYAIGLGQSMALFAEFERAKAPIRIHNFKEPRFISGGPGNLAVFNNNPHPNATKLYVNWILSKEGSTVWAQAFQYPVARQDVPKEGLNPDTLPRADDIFPDQEQMNLRVELRKESAEIFKIR
ncbi:MAG: extracellular solute-binding protein [Chloroflexi bacterium]|nr:extracellular solute-binding protein [Chloroflexota bacterium]